MKKFGITFLFLMALTFSCMSAFGYEWGTHQAGVLWLCGCGFALLFAIGVATVPK